MHIRKYLRVVIYIDEFYDNCQVVPDVSFGFSKLVQGGILYMKSDAVTDAIICDKPLSEPMLTRFTDIYAALGGDEFIYY